MHAYDKKNRREYIFYIAVIDYDIFFLNVTDPVSFYKTVNYTLSIWIKIIQTFQLIKLHKVDIDEYMIKLTFKLPETIKRDLALFSNASSRVNNVNNGQK